MKISLIFIFACSVLTVAGSCTVHTEDSGYAGRHDEDGWVLTAYDYDTAYSGVPVANGTLGILPWKEPFSVRHIILNNVSDRSGPDMVNRTVRGINPFCLTMKIDGKVFDPADKYTGISGWRQSIDMKNAEHVTEFTAGGKIKVKYRFMALRNLPYSLLMDVEVTALEDAYLEFANSMGVPEEYGPATRERKSWWIEGRKLDVLTVSAPTSGGRYEVAAASTFITGARHAGKAECISGQDSTNAGFVRSGTADRDILAVSLKKGRTAHFSVAASVCSTADFSDPWNESVRQTVYVDRLGTEKIIEGHRSAWARLWQGDIEIEGDTLAQQAVRLALFSLYGSCRKNSGLSIPPMGLSSQGYNGHIFWDAELWMFPPLLLLNRDLAESLTDYRFDRLDAAEKRALAYGYEGAMFPWESDGFGEESTPVWALTGPMEHHITADVGIAAWNFWCVTRDRKWLKEKGWPVLKAAAGFCADRATENPDGSFSVTGVVGADEYANNVTDNAFTNAAFSKVLECASKAASICCEKAPEKWNEIAEGLKIIRDTNGVTMEYSGYDGRLIKQADANLLGYPLGAVSDREQMLRDLEYYESRVDTVNGPAMTWSIFCVQHARLGNAVKAEEMFRRCYLPFSRPPFGALAETPTADNPYFVTAAGGMLQAVLNGFAGLEISDRGITRKKSVMPPSWKSITVKGLGPDRRTIVVRNRNAVAGQ